MAHTDARLGIPQTAQRQYIAGVRIRIEKRHARRGPWGQTESWRRGKSGFGVEWIWMAEWRGRGGGETAACVAWRAVRQAAQMTGEGAESACAGVWCVVCGVTLIEDARRRLYALPQIDVFVYFHAFSHKLKMAKCSITVVTYTKVRVQARVQARVEVFMPCPCVVLVAGARLPPSLRASASGCVAD